MKALMRYPLTKKQERAMQAEMLRQLNDNMASDLEATFLWALHEQFGFGAERLRRFYDSVAESRGALLRHYEMEEDSQFILLRKLEEIGVDLKQWDNEQKQHVTIHVG